MATKTTVRAYDLATLLDRAPPGIEVLSLDCFDTLLWRDTHAPKDVFCGIPLAGGAMQPRAWAEGAAQQAAYRETGSHEIRLPDIYRRLMARATDAEIDTAVEHELRLEERHLFPFAPAVALMRDARARGLTIVVVSDMYITEAQLRRLLAACAGDDVLAMVDHVFMSCEHGVSKAGGLFVPVLHTLGVGPDRVLHVGDNKHADHDGAARAGIHAVHLEQFDDDTRTRLRMEMSAGIMIDPATRVTVPAYQPHRAAVAMRRCDDPAYAVGHDVMGPVMLAFAEMIRRDCDALAARTGRRVRPLFMLRGGHLPYRVFRALYPDYDAAEVELTRLVAMRSTMTDDHALDRFLTENLATSPLPSLARSLMLLAGEWRAVLKDRDPKAAFARLLRKPETRRKVFRRAARFRDRTLAHLRRTGVCDGDGVVLVDVGYRGSVQNLIAPMLEQQMGLQVAGRYLCLREEYRSGLDKAGLLDAEVLDFRGLHSLTLNVAVLEQMCNQERGSTIDFAADGTPIHEDYPLRPAQDDVRGRIQAACVDFARTAYAAMHRRPPSDDDCARRRMVAAILTRLFYLPLPAEVALFKAFDHDNNLGSDSISRLLDHDAAEEGLRRRGLSYVSENTRMYVPAEIARYGLPLSVSLLAVSRYALDLRNSDFLVGGVEVPVLLLDATEQTVIAMTAYPTHAGYYRLAVPVPRGWTTVAVQLGRLWSAVQIAEASWCDAGDHDADRAADRTPAATMVDAMRPLADDLYACDETGVFIAAPPNVDNQVLSIIFRPLADRASAAQGAEAHRVAA